MRLFSSVISVNITPTAEFVSYQPMTSVSRVAACRAERMSSRTRSFFSVGRVRTVSMSNRTNGRCVRSLRFRSSEIIRRKASSGRTSLEPTQLCG